MFDAIGRVMYRRRRWVLAVAVVFLGFAGVWGTRVFGSLSNGGFDDPASDSAKASAVAQDRLGRDDADVIVLYRSADRTVDDPAYRQAVTSTLGALPRTAVDRVTTYWDARSAQLVSADRRETYAVLRLVGGEDQRRDELASIEGTPAGARRATAGLGGSCRPGRGGARRAAVAGAADGGTGGSTSGGGRGAGRR